MPFSDFPMEITPRESVEHDWRIDEFRMQSEHATQLKRLELDLARENHSAEIALKELEAKWRSLLKLPKLLLLLPVLVLFGLAYICSMFTKKEMPRRFWDLLS